MAGLLYPTSHWTPNHYKSPIWCSWWSDVKFWWCKLGFTPRLSGHAPRDWHLRNSNATKRNSNATVRKYPPLGFSFNKLTKEGGTSAPAKGEASTPTYDVGASKSSSASSGGKGMQRHFHSLDSSQL
eukprot:1158433-Pelagomonas_calceolata.AAC.3